MKYLIATFAALLLFLNMKPSSPATEPLTADMTILAVGDSLTHGYGAPEGQSYPALLSKMTGYHIINAGVNGETSEEGLRRLPKLLATHHPKLTILCFGGNDILQRKSLAALKTNLIQMIEMTKASGSDVLLIAVPNMTLFGLDPLDLYEEIAQETDIPLLSGIFSEILSQPSLKSDQVHPNAAGYQKLAEAVYESLKENGWIE
jgi:lysophospholipase L1-like esterase